MDDGYLSEGEGAPIDNNDFGAELEGTLIRPTDYHSGCDQDKCRSVHAGIDPQS